MRAVAGGGKPPEPFARSAALRLTVPSAGLLRHWIAPPLPPVVPTQRRQLCGRSTLQRTHTDRQAHVMTIGRARPLLGVLAVAAAAALLLAAWPVAADIFPLDPNFRNDPTLTALSRERLVLQTQHGDLHLAFYPKVCVCVLVHNRGGKLHPAYLPSLPRHTRFPLPCCFPLPCRRRPRRWRTSSSWGTWGSTPPTISSG